MPYLRQAGYVLSFTGFLISGLYVICARSYKDFLMSRAMKSSPNHTPGTALTAVWLLLLYGITLLHPWYGGTRGGMHAARATRYEHAQPGTSTRDRNTRSSLVRWVSPTFSTFESTPVIIHGRRAKCWLMYRFVLAFHSRARVQNLRYRTWRSRQRPPLGDDTVHNWFSRANPRSPTVRAQQHDPSLYPPVLWWLLGSHASGIIDHKCKTVWPTLKLSTFIFVANSEVPKVGILVWNQH